MFNDNQQFGFLDLITIFTAMIQVMDYQLTVEQASNDDIIKELKKDMIDIKISLEEIKKIVSRL